MCASNSSVRLCVLISLLTAVAGVAQTSANDPDFIVPARPTVSNPAEFQKPGVLQLETGYNGNFRSQDSFRDQFDAPVAFRFAISGRVLFELDLDSPSSFTDADGLKHMGAGDMQLGFQAVARHETRSRRGVAFAYYVKLPTANEEKGLGTGRVDHSFIALVSKTFNNTTIDFNGVWLLAGRTSRKGFVSSGQGAFAVSQKLNKKWGVQGEISGAGRNDTSPGAIYALEVVTYQLNRRVVFDCGVREGLTPLAARAGLVAGLTIGIWDFYRKRH